jgi:hypothetical protein
MAIKISIQGSVARLRYMLANVCHRIKSGLSVSPIIGKELSASYWLNSSQDDETNIV